VTNDGDVEGGYCIEEKLQGVLTLDIKICTQNKEFTLLTVFVSFSPIVSCKHGAKMTRSHGSSCCCCLSLFVFLANAVYRPELHCLFIMRLSKEDSRKYYL